jgi:signal transduction histidine kinase
VSVLARSDLTNPGGSERRITLSWLFMGALLGLCGVLGFLQYRWIGEVSSTARDRLQSSLQASLVRLSMDFNSEITSACRAILPAGRSPENKLVESEFAARYAQWKKTTHHSQLFRAIAIAQSQNRTIRLRTLNLQRAVFVPAEWPSDWKTIREQMESGLGRDPRRGGFPPGPPWEGEGATLVLRLLPPPREGPPPAGFGRPPAPFELNEMHYLIFELDLPYVRNVLLPEEIERHLGSSSTDYQIEVVTRSNPPSIVYQSNPNSAQRIASTADASVSLLGLQYDQIVRGGGPPGMREREPRRMPPLDSGRWQLYARHRAGSLEAVVSRARWRNLAVTGGVFLLLVVTIAALVRYTQRAQRLAELQMDFVAGVSHELRTPLTVINTAAYNLQTRVANQPAQVERYGALIRQESGRLKELVEQVLQFASAQAGRVTDKIEHLSVPAVIDEALLSSKAILDGSSCVVEKTIDPNLPIVLGDPLALQQVLRNLLSNAAKYGTGISHWIGVFARPVDVDGHAAVEIRVADRGPGISAEEQKQIFDPFFRGQRARQDQIHGTGLGLSLVKKIVEAHGGTVTVHSAPSKGAEFVVCIPAAPQEPFDEFTHSVS